jgi:hypothetical protein
MATSVNEKENRSIPEEYEDLWEIEYVYKEMDRNPEGGVYIYGEYTTASNENSRTQRFLKYFRDRGYIVGRESCRRAIDPQCDCNNEYHVVRW